MSSIIPTSARLRGAPLAKALSAPVEGKAVQLDPSLFWLQDNPSFRAPPDETPIRGMVAYALSALAHICMAYRATKFVEAPLWVADETAEGEQWLDGAHPLEPLLEQPNPDMEASEFWRLVSLYLDAPGGGACLIVKKRDNAGRVAQLYPYSRGEFSVAPVAGRLYGEFRVSTTQGLRIYGPDDVVFLREVDPRDPWGALSPGDAALADLNLGEQLRQAVLAAFRHAVRPGSITNVTGNYSPEQWERWRAQVAMFAGVRNFGRHLLTEGAAKTDFLKTDLRELDLGPLMMHVEATVCATYGINPLLLGLRSAGEMKGGLADSIEPAERVFYDATVIPRWTWIAKKMTQGLLRPLEPNNLRRRLRFVTDDVRALQEDVGEKVKTAAAATFWTTNEKRSFTGKTPTTNPADEELTRAPSAPTPAPPAPTPPADEKRAPATIERKAADDILWMVFDAVASAHESGLRPVVADLLTADRDAITALVRGSERKETARPLTPEEIAALEAEVVKYLSGASLVAWRAKMEPALLSIARSGVERAASSVGIAFDVLQEGILDFVERESAWLVKEISATTRDGIARALRDGLQAGDSIPTLAKRISEAASFNAERAELVARTETVRATNGAQNEAMARYAARTGRTVTRTWLTARDERVRDEHRALDGQERPIGKAFSNGELFPSAPRCRCTLLHTISEAA